MVKVRPPRKPTQPSKPSKTSKRGFCIQLWDSTSLSDILEEAKKRTAREIDEEAACDVTIENIYVSQEFDFNDSYVEASWSIEVENLAYEKQMESYNRKKDNYKSLMSAYKKKMIEYNEFKKSDEKSQILKQIEDLKKKADSL